jgi:hypothetical protein
VICIASESFEGDSGVTLIEIDVCQVIDRILRKLARVPVWRGGLADRLAWWIGVDTRIRRKVGGEILLPHSEQLSMGMS